MRLFLRGQTRGKMNGREAGDNARVGAGEKSSFPSTFPVTSSGPDQFFFVANNIFYILCHGADYDLVHPFLFVFIYKAESLDLSQP